MTPIALDAETLRAVGDLWKRQRHVVEARFAGDSMRPTIAPDDEVRIECGADAAIGNIILFTYAGRVILHRLIDVLPDGWFWTRGDGNAIADFPVAATSVIGRVTAIHRAEGWIDPSPDGPRRGTMVTVTRSLLLRSRTAGVAALTLQWRLHALAMHARLLMRRIARLPARGSKETDRLPQARATSTPSEAPPKD